MQYVRPVPVLVGLTGCPSLQQSHNSLVWSRVLTPFSLESRLLGNSQYCQNNMQCTFVFICQVLMEYNNNTMSSFPLYITVASFQLGCYDSLTLSDTHRDIDKSVL